MGLFDRIRQKKEEEEARRNQEAREKEEMLNRLRQNSIFLNYADTIFNYLSDPACDDLRWASGNSSDQRDRYLALIAMPTQFGLIRHYTYWVNDNGTPLPKGGMEPIDIHNYSDYGMQSLPSGIGWDYSDAVLDTIAMKLKTLPYLTLSNKSVITVDIENSQSLYLRAINIRVSASNLNAQFKIW